MTDRQIDAIPVARLNADACKALKAACSTDENRPTLNNVLIREGFAEATNGHVLVRVPLTDAAGDEFSFPLEMRGRRWLVHRALLGHVKPGHSLEIDIDSGDCWVVGKEGEEGYPIELPRAELELEGSKFPNTDMIVPKKGPEHREVRLGAPVLKAMLAFAGSGKDAGTLHLLIPEHSEGHDHVTRGLAFSRPGETTRSGVVMPMRITSKFEQVGRAQGDAPAHDPKQMSIPEIDDADESEDELVPAGVGADDDPFPPAA